MRIRINLLIMLVPCVAYGANPTPFATATAPIGVAGYNGGIVVTEECSQNVKAIDSGGNVTVLTSLPTPNPTPACVEKYPAVAPPASASATPAFTPGTLFITQADKIFKVVGGVATAFSTIPGSPPNTAITFDTVGTFDYKMIVTTTDPVNTTNGGKIYKVDGSGSATLLADLSGTTTTIEGPSVVPSAFGTYGGQILVGDELYSGFGAIHAIDNGGSVTYEVFDLFAAEGVHNIPNPVSSFFMAGKDNVIYKYPSTDFTGLSGDVLITSESGGGILREHWNGSSYDESTFDTGPLDGIEGGAFAALSSPTPTPTPTATVAATQFSAVLQ